MTTRTVRTVSRWLALLPLLGLMGLAACVQAPLQSGEAGAEPACGSGLSPADNTRLASIDQLVKDGKPYAALAQLDGLRMDQAAPVQLVRADALRRIDRTQDAMVLYSQLVNGCHGAQAHHGLGLLLAQQGRLAESITHLQEARRQLPTDLRVRNDLGYALLLSNRLDEARFEFLTVLDLSAKDPRASRNLVLLALREGRMDQARELARSLGLDASTFERLQRQSDTRTDPPSPLSDNPSDAASTGVQQPARP